MSGIVVSCDRWLGLGLKYAVHVDGHEVGRLGRRVKSVHTKVAPGSHSVLVQVNGNKTPTERVVVAEEEDVRLALEFRSVGKVVATAAVMPWKRRVSQPIGATPPGFMTLSRSS